MDLINLIGIIVGIFILLLGICLYVYFRQKFAKMNGFEGMINERGNNPRRSDFAWADEERIKNEFESNRNSK